MTDLRWYFLPVAFILSPGFVMGDQGFKDDFSDPNLEIRQALRGEWKYEDGVASCVSDPELYKEYKNHGPILRWPCEITDGKLEFEFKPEGCQRVVVTFNDEGHVFRMSFRDDDKTSIFGWIGRSSKENKSKLIAKEGVPWITELDGKWVNVKLEMEGDAGKIRIGDYKASLRHPSIARTKGEFTFSFAMGKCSIRNVKVKG